MTFDFPLHITAVFSPVPNKNEEKPIFSNYASYGEYSGKILAEFKVKYDFNDGAFKLIASISKRGNGNFRIENKVFEENSYKPIFKIDEDELNNSSVKKIVALFKEQAIKYAENEYKEFIKDTCSKEHVLSCIKVRFNSDEVECISF